MTALVQIRCRACQQISTLPAPQVTVRLCTDDPNLTFVEYTSPCCTFNQTQMVCDATLGGLIVAGVLIYRWVKVPPAEPLTWDDLLDFHEHLDEELAALRGAA